MRYNLRHLRVFLAVVDYGSVTRAATDCYVSQPAVTQTIAKLEAETGVALFTRSPQGLFVTGPGRVLADRVRRAFALLDPVLGDLSPRLTRMATSAQLQALIAVREAENFTLAARRMGLAQPTVHRAVNQLEQEAARPLFERTSYGMVATRPAQALAQAARLAFAELDQAEADLAEATGREVGRIVVGAMPLSRSHILPNAIVQFRKSRPHLPIRVLDGPYADLLAGLRRGEIDMLVGAIRDPAPIGDVVQHVLFHDALVLVAGRDHPIRAEGAITLDDLARYPWVVSVQGTPSRAHFDRLFAPLGARAPHSIVESGSLILMRQLLQTSQHLGCISRLQAEAEIAEGRLAVLPFDLSHTMRPIGLTLRAGWRPTAAQRLFLTHLGMVSDEAAAPRPTGLAAAPRQTEMRRRRSSSSGPRMSAPVPDSPTSPRSIT
ncbi:MAG: LysR family transcriptional regulator [Rhodobacteraceae bacterium]|nr:LysR family transcriptional regulator [Paracoccaceae bacterium]